MVNLKRIKRSVQLAFVSCASLLLGSTGFSQDTSNVLPMVPVFAKADTVLRIAVLSSSIPHFQLSSSKLDDLGAVDIGEALKFVPGVQLRDYGGIGGIKTLSYRSIGANHTAVQVDGQQIANAQTGTINLSSFEVFGLEQVSFSSGQAVDNRSTATSFSQANTIALNTILASKPNRLRIGLYSNSTTINAYENGFYFQSKIGKRFYAGVQSLVRFGSGQYSFIASDAQQNGLQTRQNTQLFNYRIRSVMGYQSQFSKITLSANYFNNEQQLPGAAVLYNPSNDQKLWNQDLRLNLNQAFQKQKWSIHSHLDYQSNYTRYYDPYYLNLQGFVDSRYQLNSGAAGLMVGRSFRFPAERIFIGADWATMSLVGNTLAGSPFRAQQNTVVGGTTLLGKFKIDGNLTTLLSTDKTGEVKGASYFKASPFLSVGYSPFKKTALRIRTFYKNTFRLPTFNDLYYNFIGNPNLKPENARMFNLGLTYGIKSKLWIAEFTADGYLNRIENKIIAIPTKDLFNWSMQNIGIAEIHGLDLSALVAVQLKDVKIQLSANQSFNKSLDRTDQEKITYNQQLPYTPYYTANYGINVVYKGFVFSSNVLYCGYRFSLNENSYTNLLPAYTDINVGISKAFKFRQNTVLIDLKALNILNKNYEVIRSFPMPGRYYQLRLKYTLDQ